MGVKNKNQVFYEEKNRYCVGTTTLIWLYYADIVRVNYCCGPDDRTNPPSLIIIKIINTRACDE